MKKQFALYDYDNTLIHGDSNGIMIKWYLKKHPLSIIRMIPVGFYGLLFALKVIPINKAKEKWLFMLAKMSDEDIKKFYHEQLVPRYYPNVVETMKKHKEEGCMIIICSASMEKYLVIDDLPYDYLIGTKCTIEHGKVHMKDKNCKDVEKVVRINEYLKENDLEIDYDHSYAYSDSTSDLPMLRMVKYRYRISKKDGSISIFE